MRRPVSLARVARVASADTSVGRWPERQVERYPGAAGGEEGAQLLSAARLRAGAYLCSVRVPKGTTTLLYRETMKVKLAAASTTRQKEQQFSVSRRRMGDEGWVPTKRMVG
jgi:hypothetical protein